MKSSSNYTENSRQFSLPSLRIASSICAGRSISKLKRSRHPQTCLNIRRIWLFCIFFLNLSPLWYYSLTVHVSRISALSWSSQGSRPRLFPVRTRWWMSLTARYKLYILNQSGFFKNNNNKIVKTQVNSHFRSSVVFFVLVLPYSNCPWMAGQKKNPQLLSSTCGLFGWLPHTSGVSAPPVSFNSTTGVTDLRCHVVRFSFLFLWLISFIYLFIFLIQRHSIFTVVYLREMCSVFRVSVTRFNVLGRYCVRLRPYFSSVRVWAEGLGDAACWIIHLTQELCRVDVQPELLRRYSKSVQGYNHFVGVASLHARQTPYILTSSCWRRMAYRLMRIDNLMEQYRLDSYYRQLGNSVTRQLAVSSCRCVRVRRWTIDPI